MCYCFPSQDINNLPHAAARSPAELLKTTSYQMNPQFRLSNFKFKFITEASLMWEEDTSLWGLWGPASITIKSNRRPGCRKGWRWRWWEGPPAWTQTLSEWNRKDPGCHSDDLFLISPLCLWTDGLNNEDGIGFLPEYASTGGLLFWWHSWHIKRD